MRISDRAVTARRLTRVAVTGATLTIFAAAFAAGCSHHSSGGGGFFQPASGAAPASSKIGASGGSLQSSTSSSKATLVVPPGAVATDTNFTIQPGTAVNERGFAPTGDPVQLGPSGAQFTTPVEVTLEAGKLPSGVTLNDVVVLRREDDGSGTVTVLAPSSRNAADGTVTVDTTSFSTFQVAVADATRNTVLLSINRSKVLADGIDQLSVTTTLTDPNGTPLAGQAIQLSVSGTSNVLSPPSLTGNTDTNGVCTWSLTSSVAETKTVTVQEGGASVSASVPFVDPTSAAITVVVGDAGIVLRTLDGGGSWDLSTPTTATLNRVTFLASGGLGWAAGNGVVLATSNRGDTWTPENTPTPPANLSLLGIQFLSSTNGWVVGATNLFQQDAQGNRIDRGFAWHKTASGYASVTISYPTHFYSAVSFVDDMNGWIAGETGTPRNPALGFNDPDEGTALVLHTTDGGATWTRLPINDASNPGQAILVDGLNDLKFIDSMVGLAVSGGQGNSASYVGVVLQTNDGGATWTATQPIAPPSPFGGAGAGYIGVATLGSSSAYIVGSNIAERASLMGTRGATGLWTFTRTDGSPPPSGTLYSVSFTDAATGFQCGANSELDRWDASAGRWTTVTGLPTLPLSATGDPAVLRGVFAGVAR